MARRNRSTQTGRYVVGEKLIPSLGAAMAYAGDQAGRRQNPGSVYVREIGREGSVARADLDEHGVVHVTVTEK